MEVTQLLQHAAIQGSNCQYLVTAIIKSVHVQLGNLPMQCNLLINIK